MGRGRLWILEGYRVKEAILRNGREQKGERERSLMLLTFKMEIPPRFSAKGKERKVLRREKDGEREHPALILSLKKKKENLQ